MQKKACGGIITKKCLENAFLRQTLQPHNINVRFKEMNALLDELKDIIGNEQYSSFLELLKEIGPDARTHRISVVIASILRFAVNKLPPDCDEGTLSQALIILDEEPYLADEQPDEYELVYSVIGSICTEAGMQNERQSSRGDGYSIADNAIMEYTAWYNMPWED